MSKTFFVNEAENQWRDAIIRRLAECDHNNGICGCSAAGTCPLSHRGARSRCTRAELQAALGDQAAQPGLSGSGSGTIPDRANQSKPTAPDLLPCPFCGRSAAVIDERNGGWQIICTNCPGGGPPFIEKQDAVTAWNRRPPSAEKTLEELLELVFAKYRYQILTYPVKDPVSFGTYCERFAPPEVRKYLTSPKIDRPKNPAYKDFPWPRGTMKAP